MPTNEFTKGTKTHHSARNQAPPLATVSLASSLRSLRRSDASRCKGVVAMASLESPCSTSVPSDSAPHQEQEGAGERGARFFGYTLYRGTVVSSVSPHDERPNDSSTRSALGWRATPTVSESEARLVMNLRGKTRRARRWENRARHPWGYSRLTTRCS